MIRAVLLTSWATAALAFYPFIPTYREGEDVTATFKVSQKSSSRTRGASSDIAAREAARLGRKYAASRTSASSADLDKRGNTYSVMTAATPSETSSVGIDQDGTDFAYFIEAKLGSTEKSVYMLCDTGAGTTWVMGTDCDSDACGMHTTWDPSESTTSDATSEGFSITYGTGKVAGTLTQDTISVGSLDVSMTFGVANTTSSDFTHFAFDGILGLAMIKGPTDNFMGSVKEDKLLKSNIFSFDLNRAEDGPNTGELTFGGIDSSKYSGDITYTPVDSSTNGEWAVALDDMGYDGTDAGVSEKLAYIDTGTTYAFGPPEDVAALHKVIPGATSSDGVTFTAPCDSDKPMTITFSGVDHEISVKDWLSDPSSKGVCTSNIYGQEVVSGAWLLGDVFLKNVYTVFDADQSRIGFASKATTSTSSTNAASTASASSTDTASSTTAASSSGSSSGTTAAADTAGSTSSPLVSSSGNQVGFGHISSILCVVAAIGLVAY
ncbi:Aspartic-type endopeptidase ctsD [Cytospora mali]|uniref:Aspartic-type endopeptidase ctsD n=1 Tax=Cytospora mali TaxID=578113 RepID=A0A194WC61_CYTMA|nr:Aspartic-type endopeptidase ctsD [Valsa mali]